MRSVIATAVCISLASVASAAAAETASRQPTQIPAQELGAALHSLAQERQLYFIFAAQDVSQLRTHGAIGSFTTDEALKQLLNGTGLTYRYIDERTVSIVPVAVNAAKEQSRKEKRVGMQTISARTDAATGGVRTAQAETNTATPSVEGASASEEAASRIQLEEVIVTGSNIRGAQNLSSPVVRIDREEIERGGYATTKQLIESLPQNFNNVSPTTVGSANGGPGENLNYNGSSLNLRGLGSDATLVLINGRRVATAGNGSFVDVSLIPLGAIERIEILTDGASAIYGSDAVGGVVNVTLREDFSGAETRLRYGSVTEGSHEEFQAGQMLGREWGSGHALVSYEYSRATELNSSDRDVFRPIGYFDSTTLMPAQTKHGALAMLSQRLSDRVELSGDFFFGRRESATSASYAMSSALEMMSGVKQYGLSLGIKADLARDWQARVSGVFDRSSSDLEQTAAGSLVWGTGNRSRLASLELAADGSFMRVSGGDARLAVGAQFRNERFAEQYAAYPAHLEREIAAVHAEVLVPLVSQENRRRGVEHLELTLAGRYENYSDFGSTFNPKIGLAWAPVRGANVRSSWGTSFKAPLLGQMNPGNLGVEVYESGFSAPTGMVTALILSGAGEGLRPEESKSWTLGLDITPTSLDGFSVSATYFDIDYDERIQSPFSINHNPRGTALVDPIYDMVVDRNPDREYLSGLLARPNAYCITPQSVLCDAMPSATDIVAIVNARLMNLAGVRMSGIDLSSSYAFESALGNWGLRVSGTNLLKNRQRIVPGAPETDEMNNVWRPVDLRLRAEVTLERGPLSAGVFLNYTDSYEDRRNPSAASARRHVSSWATVDTAFHYRLDNLFSDSLPEETTLTLTGTNMLDRRPPYVTNDYGLLYDGVNANPLGRFVSLQLLARW